MILVVLIFFLTLGVLLAVAAEKGVEATLPFFAFMAVVSPLECSIPLPGLFDLTTHRLMLVTLAALYIMSRNRKPDSPRIASTPLKILILIHIMWILVSTLNSVEFSSSLKMVLSMVFEYYVLYYILIRSITSVETIHRILYGMVLGIMVCCVFGAFEAYKGWSVLAYFPARTHHFHSGEILDVDEQRGLRVRATFPHAILYGEAIAMAIVWVFYLLAIAKSQKERVFLWAGLVLMFLNVYKTSSRGPWSALGFSMALLLLFTLNGIRKHVFIIVLLSTAICVIRPGVYGTIKADYNSTFDTDTVVGSSYEYRWALLKVGEQALARDGARQIWGYGLGTFYDLHLHGEFRDDADHEFLSCDSSWVQLMVETGYIGLLIIMILLLAPAYMTFRDLRKLPKPEAYLSWVFLITLLSFYYLMTNDAIYAWGQNGYMLWILIALTIVYPHLVQVTPHESFPAKLSSGRDETLELSAASNYSELGVRQCPD